MRRAAVLLRALLCLVLLANGMAYAHAATRMAMPHAVADAATAPSDAPPCHEAADRAGHAKPDDRSSQPADDDAAGLPDCCRSGACDGFCSQHAPATTLAGLAVGAPPPHAEAPAYRTGLHASAPLAHRHRPPIPAA